MKKPFTIRDWHPSARPRERLQKFGPEVLSDIDLLAVIMGRGTKKHPVFDIAGKLLEQFGCLRAIANATVEELTNIEGIGLAKATQIKAALQLGQRMENQVDTTNQPTIKSATDVEKLIKSKLRDKKKEYFVLIMLDTRNRLIREVDVSIGSLNASIVHPREVFKEAISASAASVICVHNHPSGDPTPSDDDIRITKRLVEAGKILDIEVFDHIIIAGDKIISMKEKKLM
ncbi:MAG: DNA repair protein RadC [Planctomycetota bacterium]|nr:DNA repair protein RadC [Planctomycetota bacterium]MDI6787804.1 DNA repair protein RadC [Planctomycetota bacterium]